MGDVIIVHVQPDILGQPPIGNGRGPSERLAIHLTGVSQPDKAMEEARRVAKKTQFGGRQARSEGISLRTWGRGYTT